MYYFIGQQFMRMDSAYYIYYIALRSDKVYRLISYPYYAKYAVEEDNIFFRHIDINVPQLIEIGRNKNMIQNSFFFDREDKDNCTEFFSGMHKYIKA